MSRSILFPAVLVSVLACAPAAYAAEGDPCARFAWDVTKELAVMKETPRTIDAATKSAAAPVLDPGKLYELKLAGQSGVTFAATPAKPTLPDGTHGGLAKFHTGKGGRYRISITSGHWIDIVDGTTLVKSRDFQGARGCERPRKIVEYDLGADRDLFLQLSGATDATILLAITAVAAPTN